MSIDFGNKLKKIRLSKNISQFTLAEIFNTTKGTISKWENGKLEPDIETIKKLAKFFDTSIDYLLDYENYDYDFEYKHNETSLIHKEKIKK